MRPVSAPLILAIYCSRDSPAESSWRMTGSSSSPSLLGTMPEGVRTIRGKPTSSSRDCIMWLMPDWV